MKLRASRRADRAPRPDGNARALYLSYDGMCDPLGGSQVLPYVIGLARRGHRISLISFEKPERRKNEREKVERACAEAGVQWHPLPYHRRPPVLSTIYDVRRMSLLAERLHKDQTFNLVHCRSYVPALVGLGMKRRHGVRFLFDMRGFWADERLEAGTWNSSNPVFRAIYAFFKRRERQFWRESDAMVSLTETGRCIVDRASDGLRDQPPISVIPCCVDFNLFRARTPAARDAARAKLHVGKNDSVLGYIGSLGGNYMLDEMLDFFRTFRERHGPSRFLFVTHTPEQELRASAAAKGIDVSELVICKATREEVPALMAAADCGIAFKQASFSAKACSPTKLSEMLALEIPVVANAGVGDVESILRETGGGVIVRTFDDDSYRAALDELDALNNDMERWRSAARRRFDLATGIERYDAIYRVLAKAAVGSGGSVG